tara:strand:- start:894 stop:1082 length:189 start_codon:yes stop_codon:yes gene_type:complete
MPVEVVVECIHQVLIQDLVEQVVVELAHQVEVMDQTLLEKDLVVVVVVTVLMVEMVLVESLS